MDTPPLARLWYLALMGITAWSLFRLFRPRRPAAVKGTPRGEDPTYLDMRRKVLTRELLPPAPAGADPKALRGVVMDWRLDRAVVTLIAVDDAVSLYYSTGGGIIGAGGHESVRNAAAVWLARTREALGGFLVTENFPLPAAGSASFWAIRNGETLLSAPIYPAAKDPGAGAWVIPLWAAAQDVITALRAITPAE